MKKIICNFSLFDMENTVYVYDNTDGAESYEPVGRCKLADIGKTIADTCFALNINNVHLFGHNKYIEGILEDIDTHSGCSAYSNGMIKVEVN
jgi:hypothetical protein